MQVSALRRYSVQAHMSIYIRCQRHLKCSNLNVNDQSRQLSSALPPLHRQWALWRCCMVQSKFQGSTGVTHVFNSV
jgi:hypothetical protein